LDSSPLRFVLLGLLALPGIAGAASLDVDDPTPRTARLKLLPSGPVFDGNFAVSAGSGVLTFPNSESKRFLEAIGRGNATSVLEALEVSVDLTSRATRVNVAGSLESDPGETFQFVDDVGFHTASDALAGSTGVEYCSSVEEFIVQCGPGGFFEGESWCPLLPGPFAPGTLLKFDAMGFLTAIGSCSFVAGSAYDESTGHSKLVGLQFVFTTGSDGGGPPIFSFFVDFAEPEVLLLEAAPPVPALSPRGVLALGFALVLALAGAVLLGARRRVDTA